ncbi:class I SAM-dependent methyltransferase [Allonocardiopsis opalescens]|uniref:Ubiquinone/menaquinone biosynthesis C-methylase UbiE n=1 Tax=Allonocardiopsis opalescens TaxID=1144618 RepID=A0A2T0QB38_9ACTN|nr:class I SAM-dependent methyltransferase [Allonocardiopsis opalescens]PRY01030.1 ubiquinone/menaquinone biosynthesis C-methylase UbiE [Allonocardiopsis opalescens]
MSSPAPPAERPGSRIYRPWLLRLVYDLVVLRLSCRMVWGCPEKRLVREYREHIGDVHLDIGPGPGTLLVKARPRPGAVLHLLDLNPEPLRMSEQRLAAFTVHTYHADALAPWPLEDASVGSVGLSLVVHTLPGKDIAAKAHVLDEAARVAVPGGRVFGSTVVSSGEGLRMAWPARRLSDAYNRAGIFDNRGDDADDLRRELEVRFTDVRFRVHGTVAVWSARTPA